MKYVRHRDRLGALGIDVLADLASIIQGAENTVANAAPTWIGGTPLTSSQLQAIQAQAAQQITQAAGGNSALAAQAISQMQAQTQAVADQSYSAASASDTSIPGLLSPALTSSLSSLLLWGALALVGLVVVVKAVE
ncbi:MAG: hypothetical protein ABSF45_18775 [Terriglobia bacterium]|jgi:hypothetical protein